MLVDWNNFTPWTALSGGALIGIAASLLILLNGRVAGICGIIGGLWQVAFLSRFHSNDINWRMAFVAGLTLSPVIWGLFAPLPPIQISSNYGLLALAGFIVGLGSRYGSGCTSGHGVCGISRLSIRSIVATLAFMSSGFLTVFVTRHLLG